MRYDRYTDEGGQDMGMIVFPGHYGAASWRICRGLLANVSHELKTPLTTIKSYTETLMDTEINDCSTIEHFSEL